MPSSSNDQAVPDLVGRPAAQAKAALDNVGLVPVVVAGPIDSFRAGTVTHSEPASGTEVEPGTTVTIWVARAP